MADTLSPKARQAIQDALERHAGLFDTLEKQPLTCEQRFAAVAVAHRQLLIAAAGSGKTSTIVGKVVHAIRSGQLRAEQILVLAFNRKAAQELDLRLRGILGDGSGPDAAVAVSTTHALGLKILTAGQARRPTVLDASSGWPRPDGLLATTLRDLLHNDACFAEHWLMFRVFWHTPVRHADEFSSRRDWRRFVAQYGTRQDRRRGFLTLNGVLVATQFEQAVGNWLGLYGMTYRYARAWPGWNPLAACGYGAAAESGAGALVVGQPPLRIRCVQQPPRRVDPGTLVLTQADFRHGRVFGQLRQRLDALGAMPPRPYVQTALQRIGHGMTPAQWQFLQRFLNGARRSGASAQQLYARRRATCDPQRVQLYWPMLHRLITAWDTALQRKGMLDFDAMLSRGIARVESGRYPHGWKLILVDEFQDTSQATVRLLGALLAQHPGCRLFAVGDDWQSIYRFAGAMPDALRRFQAHFGPALVSRLTTTFRFDQQLADVASRFIQANPDQLQKQVRARRTAPEPPILVDFYTSPQHMLGLCRTRLEGLIARLRTAGVSRPRVFVLGRYRHLRPQMLEQWQSDYPDVAVDYHTVHAVKGLEADAVIVIGLAAGRHGFPAQGEDDALMELVLPPADPFPHAEERRLFYVALTRTRGEVCLLACARRPSSFVLELMAVGRDGASCPAATGAIISGSSCVHSAGIRNGDEWGRMVPQGR